MADLVSLSPLISQGTRLALSLHESSTNSHHDQALVEEVATAVSQFSRAVRQLYDNVRNDDSIPSSEAFETIEEVADQGFDVFRELGKVASRRDSVYEEHSDNKCFGRNVYLQAYLDSLRLTMEVMVQAFRTLAVIRDTRIYEISKPLKAADMVADEKEQMNVLVIEQQVAILKANRLYESHRRRLSNISVESQQLVRVERDDSEKTSEDLEHPNVDSPPLLSSPRSLQPYQEISLTQLNSMSQGSHVNKARQVSSKYVEQLLRRWTRLDRDEERWKRDAEDEQRRRNEDKQATVDTDSEEEVGVRSRRRKKYFENEDRRGSHQPILSYAKSSPERVSQQDTTASRPSSEDKQSKRSSLEVPTDRHGYTTLNGHRSNGSVSSSPQMPNAAVHLPIRAAAAAATAVIEDNDELEIPWRLCSGSNYWTYIDGQVRQTNTHLKPEHAYRDKKGYTEILASWVCREALEESKYPFSQVQKQRNDSSRTKFDTAFIIDKPLQFAEVNRLVERTIDLIREKSTIKMSPTANAPVPPRLQDEKDRRPTSSHSQYPPPPPGPPPSQQSQTYTKQQQHQNTYPPPSQPSKNSNTPQQPHTNTYPPPSQPPQHNYNQQQHTHTYRHPPPPPLDRSFSTPSTQFHPHHQSHIPTPQHPHAPFPPNIPSHPQFSTSPSQYPPTHLTANRPPTIRAQTTTCPPPPARPISPAHSAESENERERRRRRRKDGERDRERDRRDRSYESRRDREREGGREKDRGERGGRDGSAGKSARVMKTAMKIGSAVALLDGLEHML